MLLSARQKGLYTILGKTHSPRNAPHSTNLLSLALVARFLSLASCRWRQLATPEIYQNGWGPPKQFGRKSTPAQKLPAAEFRLCRRRRFCSRQAPSSHSDTARSGARLPHQGEKFCVASSAVSKLKVGRPQSLESPSIQAFTRRMPSRPSAARQAGKAPEQPPRLQRLTQIRYQIAS